MAEALPLPLGKPLAAFTALPMQRQFGLLLGLAMVIALAVSLAVWGLRPTYQPLLPGMAERDVVQAMSVLSRLGIEHKLDPATGSLTVPAVKMHEARLHLATEGIPRAQGVGFELLDEQTGIGSSRMVEAARFQRALEGELARSVMTLDSVESARVHLALPRESVFVRDRVKPGASVLINLRPGRTLDDKQVAGVIHMVASSVPELLPERVTVIDQRGRLLSSPEDDSQSGMASRQLEYTREVEDALRSRVEDILSPLLGPDGMSVQVTAAVDFTRVESTREVYDPDASVLRSEQINEEQRAGLPAGGIPGALSNQPPDGATIAQPLQTSSAGAGTGGAAADETQPVAAAAPTNRSRSSTRNFELDRTISHIQEASANLERLSVAVVVDDKQTTDESGEPVRVPRGEEEMAYLRSLVEEAIGFNEARGDRLNVVNASFRAIEQPEALPALPLWQEPWALDLIKQAGSGLGILLLLLLVVRPALKTLARQPVRPAMPPALAAPTSSGAVNHIAGTIVEGQAVVPTLEGSLEHARKLTREDPRLIAQVVRQWVRADEK